jgi:hypothetical protein
MVAHKVSLMGVIVASLGLPFGALGTELYHAANGEIGLIQHSVPSSRTRAEVIKELEAAKRNPVSADGWRNVGGEEGVRYVGLGQAGSKSRAQVIQEFHAYRANPVEGDGWVSVRGEGSGSYVNESPRAAAGPSGQAAKEGASALRR